ncbi:hypothetical protein SAMN05444680_11445 [Variovorax sp. YR216]|nr:hypothetical protein SAMN05444680_11445 [Variovorax sp. YR216]
MKLTPSLAHFVWLGHPLPGGNPSGPAEPVPRGSWFYMCPFHAPLAACNPIDN